MENNQKRLFKVLNKYYSKSDTLNIFDIGSRDCQESVRFSQYYKNANIYAFECNPSTIPLCKKNISSHKKIHLTEKAVTDKVGVVTFYPINTKKTISVHKDGNPGASSLFRANGSIKNEVFFQDKIKVKATTLDSFTKKEKINHVDIMWVDVQGAEMLVLKGFSNGLKNVGIIHIELEFVEIYKKQALFNEVKKFLNKHGFSLITFTSFSRYFCDAVFVNNSLGGPKSNYMDNLILPYYKYIGVYFFYFNYIVDFIHGILGKINKAVSQ